MPSTAIDGRIKAEILRNPGAVLHDDDILAALIKASDEAAGENVIDLRGIALERLHGRLDQLETTHRVAVANAYDTISGMHQIHRATLELVSAASLQDLLQALASQIPDVLRVDVARLVLEVPGAPERQNDRAASNAPDAATLRNLAERHETLELAKPGFVDAYMADDRGSRESATSRKAALRPMRAGDEELYATRTAASRAGDATATLAEGSEACLRLDLGDSGPHAMLCLACLDPRAFTPNLGTDLLEYLAAALSCRMKNLLK